MNRIRHSVYLVFESKGIGNLWRELRREAPGPFPDMYIRAAYATRQHALGIFDLPHAKEIPILQIK